MCVIERGTACFAFGRNTVIGFVQILESVNKTLFHGWLSRGVYGVPRADTVLV
jgi:hypothetical protein